MAGFAASVTFLIIGSFLCFLIFRHYGDLFVQAFIPDRVYQKSVLAFSKPLPTFIYFAGATGLGNVLINWLPTVM
ncbi:MAG: hypothetical protein ABS863_06675 [Aerococcus urinaeequi]